MSRLAYPLAALLASTPVTGNHVTSLRLLTGLAAAVAFALGTPFYAHIGGAFFVLSLVLDHVDGTLARLKRQTSPFGYLYDLWSDGATNALVFVGIGIGLHGGALGAAAIPLGVLVGLSIAAIFAVVQRLERRSGGAALGWTFAGLEPDYALLAVPVAAWLGGLPALLLAAAAAAPLVLGLMVLFARRA